MRPRRARWRDWTAERPRQRRLRRREDSSSRPPLIDAMMPLRAPTRKPRALTPRRGEAGVFPDALARDAKKEETRTVGGEGASDACRHEPCSRIDALVPLQDTEMRYRHE